MSSRARPTGRRADASVRLDPAAKEKLVAVVVDANAYGQVGPDIAGLTQLAADLAKVDIKTWIPEPVAWEWADHLAAEWRAIRNVLRDRGAHFKKAGLPSMSPTLPYATHCDLIEAFLQALHKTPHIEVISLSGESAVEGLKDQILRRPPAKTKSQDAVKTGGSDSAWLRDVIARAGDPNSLLFLSQDRDIRLAYEEWGHEPPLMRTRDTIRPSLFEDVSASAADTWLVARHLYGRMPMVVEESPDGTDSQFVGATIGLPAAVDLDWEEHGWTGGSLTRLTALAGLTDIKCEAPELYEPGRAPNVRTIRATAFFLADAEITHLVQLGEEESARDVTWPRTGLIARTQLVLRVRDGEVIQVRPDSETEVFAPSQYMDPSDAIDDALGTLTLVPGLEPPSDWEGIGDSDEQEISVDGIGHLITWSEIPGEHGGFTVEIDGEEAQVTCEYDDSTWVGGRDGMYLEPPFHLVTETPTSSGFSEWALTAWITGRLLEQRNDDQG